MYKNDNDKKYALLALICAAIAVTLVSCGKRAAKIMGGAHDVAFRAYTSAGWDADKVWEMSMPTSESYSVGLTGEQFEGMVAEAVECRPTELTAEQSLYVLHAKSEKEAGSLYDFISANYEWAPCDPASEAMIMQYGDYVLIARGSGAEAEALLRAFREESHGKARVYHTKNPM
jgi:hypothetical protein